MKKIFILSILALLGITQSVAQNNEYIPFVREGVQWVCSTESAYNYPIPNKIFTLEFKGDVVINGLTYKAMHKYSGEEIDSSNDTIPVYMREENKVVYAIVPEGKTYEDCPIDCFGDSAIEEDIRAGREFVLYDFNDPEGFIMSKIPKTPLYHNGELVDLHQVMPQTIMLGDKKATRYIFYSYRNDFCFIEGIGCDGLYHGYPLAYRKDGQPLKMHLNHVIENGKVIYRSERLNIREDEILPIAREGVQWVNERVVINHGDTTRCYYTYEIKDKDDRERWLCHYYEGDSLDCEQDSVITRIALERFYNNKALTALASKYPERIMVYFGVQLYSFNGYYESVISSINPIVFYTMWQRGDDLTLDNFVEVEPVWIEGYKCRRYAYYGDGDEPLCYIVEGIGFDSRDMGDLLTPFTRQPDPDADYQEYWGLSHVIKDGEIIYKGMRYKEPSAKGDVNGDGQVTIADVTTLIDMLLGAGNTGGYYTPGDINMDSHVTIADVTALIDMLLMQE